MRSPDTTLTRYPTFLLALGFCLLACGHPPESNPPLPPAPCPEGEILYQGSCVDTCPSGTSLYQGTCTDDATRCGEGRLFYNGACQEPLPPIPKDMFPPSGEKKREQPCDPINPCTGKTCGKGFNAGCGLSVDCGCSPGWLCTGGVCCPTDPKERKKIKACAAP